MLSPLLVPLQYLYLTWRAESLTVKAGKAGKAGRDRAHVSLMRRAENAIARVETLQVRFPSVTDWVDERSRRGAMRARLAA